LLALDDRQLSLALSTEVAAVVILRSTLGTKDCHHHALGKIRSAVHEEIPRPLSLLQKRPRLG